MLMIMDVIRLIVGLALLTLGGSFIRDNPRIGGALALGLVAAEVAARTVAFSGIWVILGPVAALIVGGLVGAVLGNLLSMFMLVIYTILLGAVVGYIAGFIVMFGQNARAVLGSLGSFSTVTPIQTAFMIIFALVFGLLAIRFQDFMALASTAFIGSALTVLALAGQVRRMIPVFREDVVVVFTWVVLGLFGLIWQNNNSKEN